MHPMSKLEAEINKFRGTRIPGQRGRKLRYALCQAAHPAIAPDGFIVVFLGARKKNTLTLTREKARLFLQTLTEQVTEQVTE